ncbi:Phosphatidylglycerol/phosphatidylinositol transfer protein [Thermoascus aurantiacus ATCC 26904]
MKLSSAVSACLLLLAPLQIAARSLSFFEFEQSSLKTGDGGLKVNGSNPLTYCSDPSQNILQIDSVDLSPNPPVAGKTLTIHATGTFRETVDKGAKVLLQVRYGLIRLINQEADLCDQIENVDLQCPLEKGEMTLTKQFDLPKEIPPGKYFVTADVYTKDNRKVTCLEANNIAF